MQDGGVDITQIAVTAYPIGVRGYSVSWIIDDYGVEDNGTDSFIYFIWEPNDDGRFEGIVDSYAGDLEFDSIAVEINLNMPLS